MLISRSGKVRLAAVVAGAGLAVTAGVALAATAGAASGQRAPATAAMVSATALGTVPDTVSPVQGPARTYTVTAPVRTLVVTTSPSGGDIAISGSQRSTVQITVRSSYFTAPPHLQQSLSHGTLTLGYSCTMCGVTYDIKVPRGITVDATAYRGGLTLSSLTGDVTAYTGTGSLTGTSLSCKTAVFRDDLGGISVSYGSPPALIRASGSGASITIRVPGDVGYDVHASRGADIAVRRSSATAHVIDAQSGSGPVKILPITR